MALNCKPPQCGPNVAQAMASMPCFTCVAPAAE